MNFPKLALLTYAGLLVGSAALAGPSTFSYQGRLYDETTGLPSTRSVQFILGIYDPAANCLLHEEQTAAVDLSASDGYFAVEVGNSSNTLTANNPTSPVIALADVFSNKSTFTIAAPTATACSYTPVYSDGRKLKVSVKDGATITAMSPTISIGAAPFAMVADSLQGMGPSAFLQPNTASSNQLTQANLETIFTSTNFVNLQQLLTGTSSLYVKPSANQTVAIPGFSTSGPTSLQAGQMWYDSGTNQMKFYDGTSTLALSTSGTGGGTVTNVTGTAPIVVTAGSTTPAISLANTTVTAGTYGSAVNIPTFTVDSQGRLTAASNVALAAGDLKSDGSVSMTAPFQSTAGSQTSPGITFIGYTSTGLYSAGSNNLGVSTNGSERIRVTAAGDVGIGTASPSELLTVSKNIGNTDAALLTLDNTTSSTLDGTAIRFTSNGTTQSKIVSAHGGVNGNSYLAFWTTNGGSPGEKLRINNLGSVGIGTTSPTSLIHSVDSGVKTAPYKGVVHAVTNTSTTSSVAKIGMDIQSTGAWTGASATNTGLNVNATGGATNYAAVFTGGNVGIGVTNPAANLHVQNSSGDSTILNDTSLSTNASKFTSKNGSSTLEIASYGSGAGGTIITGVNYANLKSIITDGTTSEGLLIGTMGSGQPLYFSTNSQLRMGITPTGHIMFAGATPTVGTCGTSPTISGNDTRGIVTLGTGSPTACTITFSASFTTPPTCVISPYGTDPGSGSRWWITSTSTTNFIMGFASVTTSQKFSYHCFE